MRLWILSDLHVESTTAGTCRPVMRGRTICGHTYGSEDRVIGATRVVSNAKGYGPRPPQQRGWGNRSFDANCIVEI